MSVHYSPLYMYCRIDKGTVTAPSYPLPAKMSTTLRSHYYRELSITDQHLKLFLFFFLVIYLSSYYMPGFTKEKIDHLKYSTSETKTVKKYIK